MTGNEVALKQQNALAHASLADDVFDDLDIDSSDIIIPKLLLMQPSSQFVGDEKAQIGEYRHSLNGSKVGSVVEPIVIVPFYSKKSWDIMNVDDNNSWLRNEPFTIHNATLPWTDKENGMNIKRVKRLDFFCMVPSQIAAGSVLPMVVSFKSTGYKHGSVIVTEWSEVKARNQKAKETGKLEDMKLPFSKAFILSGQKLKNEKNQIYCVPNIQVSPEPVSDDVQKLCLQWLNTVKIAKNIVVDESDNGETAATVDVPVGETGKF